MFEVSMRRGRKNENNGWKNREKTANQQMQREKHKEGRGSETTDRQTVDNPSGCSLTTVSPTGGRMLGHG